MTLPVAPYEAITQQLIEADQRKLAELQARRDELDKEISAIQQRIMGYDYALAGYRLHWPSLHNNGTKDTFAEDQQLAQQMQGFTSLQALIKLGLLDNRILAVAPAVKTLHRLGVIKGQWKFIPPRMYTVIAAHPDIFEKAAPGIYRILDGAETLLLSPGKRAPTPKTVVR